MSSSRAVSGLEEIDTVVNRLSLSSVVDLKSAIVALNKHLNAHISRSGKKGDLVERMAASLRRLKTSGDLKGWNAVRSSFISLGILLSLPRASSSALPAKSAPIAPHLPGSISAPVRKNFVSTDPFRFKPSPFFSVEETVSTVYECPESYNAQDRREAFLKFSLTPAQLAKLNTPNSTYQVRLFCTSSKFYSAHRATNPDLPIEFPSTCEVFINDVQLKSTALKGMKKTPGTAPPPDLGVGTLGPGPNVVRMIYINHSPVGTQVEYKRFYLVAQLVKTQSVNSLVNTLVANNFVPADRIRQKMISTASEDDDIIAGTLKLPLKCPLSFARIALPCRSSRCAHSQCFDATSWYAVMEQTTTWLCPICENVLDWRDLIIDGFFAEILRLTPTSVDDVLLEADGTWRTPDGRYSSSNPFSAAAAKGEVISLDSDDDD